MVILTINILKALLLYLEDDDFIIFSSAVWHSLSKGKKGKLLSI